MVMAEHRHLVENGAKLIELRLDYLRSKINLGRLTKGRPGPVIVTCRRQRDGGLYKGTDDERLVILREAIASGVDYVDLEEDIAGKVPRFGPTKRIVSYHDFRNTPDDLDAVYDRLAALDADIVKIATMANHPHDNVRMLELVRRAEIPTAGFCMGDIGTPSRFLAGRFGSPLTYATFHHERALAPGQISYDEMVNLYHYDEIDDATVVYGVIADPISHSLSPAVHNAAFRKAGINAVYIPFRVPRQDLEKFMVEAPKLGIEGLSVTIPHKEAIGAHLTKVDPAVKGIGAVNTVLFKDDGVLGYNTDYKAAMDSLELAMGGEQEGVSPLQGRTAMVLGAGGAARAIVYGLRRRGANIAVASRTFDRAKELAEEYEGRAVEWKARHGVAADVLINCTPIGMHPDVDETPYEKHRLRPSMVVFDTVYNPENTLLIKEAREQSCHVVTGVEMFVRQASLQFFLFTGQKPPDGLVREVLKKNLSAARE
jgi:3-dehydroquinate dehydratase/shikimate dehydrogenase